MLGSALVGYGALAVAIFAVSVPLMLIAGLVAVLALYRAGLFIHEMTHLKAGSLPGFKLAWNALVGVPLLVPSFMYEGIHNLHHAKIRYGTVEDPEYLPLALMKPWTLPVFVLASLLAPVGADLPLCRADAAVAADSAAARPWWSDAFRASRSTPRSAASAPKANSRANGRGWKAPRACGRSHWWLWSRPGSCR